MIKQHSNWSILKIGLIWTNFSITQELQYLKIKGQFYLRVQSRHYLQNLNYGIIDILINFDQKSAVSVLASKLDARWEDIESSKSDQRRSSRSIIERAHRPAEPSGRVRFTDEKEKTGRTTWQVEDRDQEAAEFGVSYRQPARLTAYSGWIAESTRRRTATN